MNFEEKKDILRIFKEYPELIAAYTPTSIMASLLLKDGKDPEDLFYKGKSTSEFIGYNFLEYSFGIPASCFFISYNP